MYVIKTNNNNIDDIENDGFFVFRLYAIRKNESTYKILKSKSYNLIRNIFLNNVEKYL